MTRMTLRQAVRNSIEVERAAEQFYRTLADSTEDEEAKVFLEEMADQEACHQRCIREFANALNASELPFRADDNVELIETAPEWADVDNLSYEEALVIALENENHAMMYYNALSDVSEGEVSEFFKKLVKDEQSHIARLTKRTPQNPT